MSDKELEEYINKIEPNFNSHLEKGTIEMSNEYYNLLEEKMVRLINKNKELKKQLEEANEKILLLQVSEPMLEYKKALEENQQKEFIKYLTSYIKLLSNDPDFFDEWQKDILEEILSKYKEMVSNHV